MKTGVTALTAALVAVAFVAGSAGSGTGPDSGLIAFSTTWLTRLDADPSDDSPPDVTTILCGVDVEGRTYRFTEPDAESAPPLDPAWAPDGIHWAATYVGHVPGLVTHGIGFGGLDGSGGGGADGMSASWSPDGTQIAYSPEGTTGVVIAPVAQPRAVTARFATASGRAAWSPDGSQLALAEGPDLHVVRADGSGDRLLLGNARNPDWSPDGRTLVVGRVPAGGGVQTLALIGADGTGLRDLGIAGSSPTWSPSGTSLAYLDGHDDLVTAAADGSSPHVLFRGWAGGTIDWQPVPHPELLANRQPCVISPPPEVHLIDGSAVADDIWGTSEADTIHAGAGSDVVGAESGADVVDGGSGADQIDGGAGDDRIDGGPGDDLIRGGPGNDRLVGGPGADDVEGGSGDDVILARDGERDTISCGSGHDVIIGDAIDQVSSDCENVRGPDLLLGDTTPPSTYVGGEIRERFYVSGHSSYRLDVAATDAASGVAHVFVETSHGRVIVSRAGRCRTTTSTRVPHRKVCDADIRFSVLIRMRTLPEGYNHFRVVAVDAAGHRGGRANWSFFVDRTGPRAHSIDVWNYDRLHHTAWVETPTGGSDPDGGSGTSRLVYRYRVTTMRWSRWINPDAGSRDTFTPVIEARGVLPGDTVHAQIRETDDIGNVGPVVELAVRVRGTEHNLTDLPPAAGPDGPPVVNLDGPAMWAGYAGGDDSLPLTVDGESSFGAATVSLEEARTGRTVASGSASCSSTCPFSYLLHARIDTRTLPEGLATFLGRTSDTKGRTAASPKLELAVDRTPPPAPRFVDCGFSADRGLAAIGWTATDRRLHDGTPGSGTAHLRFRYRAGATWSRWSLARDAPTLYVRAPIGARVQIEARAGDLVGNESRLGRGTIMVRRGGMPPGASRAPYPCNS